MKPVSRLKVLQILGNRCIGSIYVEDEEVLMFGEYQKRGNQWMLYKTTAYVYGAPLICTVTDESVRRCLV